jgi:hypothetical protein
LNQGARLERVRSGQPQVQHLILRKGPRWDEHVTPAARLALRLAGISLSQCGTLLWQEKLGTLEALATDRMSHKDRQMFDRLVSVLRVQVGALAEVLEPADLREHIRRQHAEAASLYQ